MEFERGTYRSQTGADLALYGMTAAGRARAIVLICHGVTEHIGRYRDFAAAMAGAGYHVLGHDHRGHGHTRAPSVMSGQFAARNGASLAIRDLAAVRNLAVGRHPDLPVILFGHSMGGLIALNGAQEHPGRYDALAVWNSNFHPRLTGRLALSALAVERMLKGSDVPSPLLWQLTAGAWSRSVPDRRTDSDWLSQDARAVDAYLADPLCKVDITVSLWIDLLRMSYCGATAERLARLDPALPVHLVGGGEDPATLGGREVRWLAERMAKAGLRDVTTVVYPEARHETLNDTVRGEAIRDFKDWCDRVTREK